MKNKVLFLIMGLILSNTALAQMNDVVRNVSPSILNSAKQVSIPQSAAVEAAKKEYPSMILKDVAPKDLTATADKLKMSLKEVDMSKVKTIDFKLEAIGDVSKEKIDEAQKKAQYRPSTPLDIGGKNR